MNTNGISLANFLILDAKNWDRWSAMLKSLFGSQDVYDVFQTGYEELPPDATVAQRNTFKESKEAWDILVKYHDGGDKVKQVKLQSLRRKYELMLMEDDQRIADYCSKLMVVVNQMRTCEDLQSSLEAHELLVIDRGTERNMQQALYVQAKNGGKDKNKWKKGKEKWLKSKEKVDDKAESSKGGGFVNNQKKKFDKSKIQCYNCEKYGHFADECKYGKDKKRGKSDEEANIAHGDNEVEQNVLLMMATTCESNPLQQEWYLDSGCSNHMTGNKGWFSDIDTSKRTSVKLADCRSLEAEGIDNIVIRTSSGKRAMIENVLYVPGMKCNLMSIGQLMEKDFSININKESLKLFDPEENLIVVSTLSKNRVYKCNIPVDRVMCLTSTTHEDADW
ncbi:retrovirus-related Pol polyprotein from transposon TNT 1-94, partial [Trifolium pratense]